MFKERRHWEQRGSSTSQRSDAQDHCKPGGNQSQVEAGGCWQMCPSAMAGPAFLGREGVVHTMADSGWDAPMHSHAHPQWGSDAV